MYKWYLVLTAYDVKRRVFFPYLFSVKQTFEMIEAHTSEGKQFSFHKKS